jgi:hypothetical protein
VALAASRRIHATAYVRIKPDPVPENCGNAETTYLHHASLSQQHRGAIVADDGLAALMRALLQLGECDLHLAVLHLVRAHENAARSCSVRQRALGRALMRARPRLAYDSSRLAASQSRLSNALQLNALWACRYPPAVWDSVGKRRHAMMGSTRELEGWSEDRA